MRLKKPYGWDVFMSVGHKKVIRSNYDLPLQREMMYLLNFTKYIILLATYVTEMVVTSAAVYGPGKVKKICDNRKARFTRRAIMK